MLKPIKVVVAICCFWVALLSSPAARAVGLPPFSTKIFSGLSIHSWDYSIGNWVELNGALSISGIDLSALAIADTTFYPDQLYQIDVDVESRRLGQ